jgi:isopenicillin N synthase-like dioxygenase
MCDLFKKLQDTSEIILEAIASGLALEGEEYSALRDLKQDYQLRLLHYPAISKEKLQNEMLGRLPAHHDWW